MRLPTKVELVAAVLCLLFAAWNAQRGIWWMAAINVAGMCAYISNARYHERTRPVRQGSE